MVTTEQQSCGSIAARIIAKLAEAARGGHPVCASMGREAAIRDAVHRLNVASHGRS
jgi:hypothetical protein